MFNLLKKQRFGISTLFLSLDGRRAASLLPALNLAQKRILDTDGDFDVAQAECTRATTLLLEHRAALNGSALEHAAFKKEEEAGDHGANVFAGLAARYQDLPVVETPARVVVALTVGYRGQDAALEKPVHDANDVRAALTALLAVAQRDQAALWHLHVVPLPDDEDLATERFPELLTW